MARNLLDIYQRNPTFDPSWGAGMQQLPEGNIFVPDGWNLGWLADVPFEGIHNEPPGLVARRPEATIINEWMNLEPELTPDYSYAWKIFVQNPLYAMITLNSPITLPAGNYKLQVKVWPKLHMNGAPGNPHPSDPWAAEVGRQFRLQALPLIDDCRFWPARHQPWRLIVNALKRHIREPAQIPAVGDENVALRQLLHPRTPRGVERRVALINIKQVSRHCEPPFRL